MSVSQPENKTELIAYAFRRLGAPVVEVNIDTVQAEDIVEEAFQKFTDYHYDGTELVYFKSEITPSVLTFTTTPAVSFSVGEIITGSTSNHTATVYKILGNTIEIYNTTDSNGFKTTDTTFTSGETIIGQTSDAIGIFSSIIFGSYDNEYIIVDENIMGITKVLPISTTKNIYSHETQMKMNSIPSSKQVGSIKSYVFMQQHLTLLDNVLGPSLNVRFNRLTDQVHIDMDWNSLISIGDIIVIECNKQLNSPEMYNDSWIKKYVTALLKIQWGTNLMKFDGMQLPGGITVDGKSYYDQGLEERDKLEERLLQIMPVESILIG